MPLPLLVLQERNRKSTRRALVVLLPFVVVAVPSQLLSSRMINLRLSWDQDIYQYLRRVVSASFLLL